MIYLDKKSFNELTINWKDMLQVIKDATFCLKQNDYSQPIKPYLKYNNPQNRIIAMPAFLGGAFQVAGIKWIASFPENINKNIPRAHSVTILNKADTGEPIAIFNTPILSIIRTASVTGAILEKYFYARDKENLVVGIVGFGPIGRYHLDMMESLFGNRISQFRIYDLRPINLELVNQNYHNKVVGVKNWQDAYIEADIFITCTTSQERYIDKKPKQGALLANVSLRDFKKEVYEYIKDGIFVDSWEEVCRENTDIEQFSLHCGLMKDQVKTITNIICDNVFETYSLDIPLMINPMGMAIYDLATAFYYMRELEKHQKC